MSLPAGGPWPPPPHGVAFTQQAVWSAWLVGDPEGLAQAYGQIASPNTDFFNAPDPLTNRPSQYAGGIVGTVARAFWGRPSTYGTRKARLHVPLAADIATASADLLFSEPPQFVSDEEGGNQQAADRIDELLNCGDFHAELVECAEVCAALGGGWLRCVWDADVADHVMFDAVSADLALGEWRWGRLQAVTFFTEYSEANDTSRSTVYRHLERHEPGFIYHGLYRGDGKSLGNLVALDEHEDTEPYSGLVNEDGAIATGVKGLTAAYVANMRPQRRWRRIEALANLGRSDYDGVEPLMDALDETYTSWMRDVRLAKSRIIVPEFMLDNLGRGKGLAWDEDKEVYTALNILSDDNAAGQITPQQFAIRVAEHQETAKQLVEEILRAAGYSPGTLGSGENGLQTATEVKSREQESGRTRAKKMRYWSQALEPLLGTWLELDALVFGTGAKGEVEVVWAEDTQAEPEALSRTVETLNRALAVSTETKVRMLHSDWDEAAIAAEVALIQKETGMSVPDLGPLPFTSMATEEVPVGR